MFIIVYNCFIFVSLDFPKERECFLLLYFAPHCAHNISLINTTDWIYSSLEWVILYAWVWSFRSRVQWSRTFAEWEVLSLFCYIRETDSNWYYERLFCIEISPVPKLDLTNVAFLLLPRILVFSKGKFKLSKFK